MGIERGPMHGTRGSMGTRVRGANSPNVRRGGSTDGGKGTAGEGNETIEPSSWGDA